jgi:hypothetical protein
MFSSPPYTSEEDAILLEHRKLPPDCIVAVLQKFGFTRSTKSVRERRLRLLNPEHIGSGENPDYHRLDARWDKAFARMGIKRAPATTEPFTCYPKITRPDPEILQSDWA